MPPGLRQVSNTAESSRSFATWLKDLDICKCVYKYIYIYDRALFLFWNSVRKKGNKTKQIPLNCLGGPKDVGSQLLVIRKAPNAF